MNEVCVRYLSEYVAVRCKLATAALYRSVVNRHVLPALGRAPSAALSLAQVAEFHESLYETPAVANMALRTLSAMYEQAARWGMIPEGCNPCRSIMKYPERRGEIVSLRREQVDMERRTLRVEETKTGEPLELPITRQLAAILERSLADGEDSWVFPSPRSGAGHVSDLARFYGEISEKGGKRFWFHGLRNAFITVAERELMLPRSLTKRLVNHARPQDVTEGYAADWSVEQLREPAQRIADRIDELMKGT